jgi:hypothetical protein
VRIGAQQRLTIPEVEMDDAKPARGPRARLAATPRRTRMFLVIVFMLAPLIAGAVLYDAGRHGLGAALLLIGLFFLGLVVGPALAPQGRGAENAGMVWGERTEVPGFDKPRDHGHLL